MANHSRLQNLSARMNDQLRQFAADDEDRTGRAIAGVAGAGAAAAGAYKLRQGAINRGGVVDDYGNMVARKGMYKKAAQGVAGDMKKKARGVAGDALGGGSSLLRKGAGVLAKGRKKLYGLEREFAVPDDYYSRYPIVNPKYRAEHRRKRGEALLAAGGLAAGGAVGYGMLKPGQREEFKKTVKGAPAMVARDVRAKAGEVAAKAKGTARQGLRSAASSAGQASNQLYRKATKEGAAGVVSRIQGKGSSVLAKTAKKLRGAARSFDAEQIGRIVHLARRIEGLA